MTVRIDKYRKYRSAKEQRDDPRHLRLTAYVALLIGSTHVAFRAFEAESFRRTGFLVVLFTMALVAWCVHRLARIAVRESQAVAPTT